MKKGLFDIEDFAWFFGFVFLLVVVVIVLSMPSLKGHMQQRISLADNELEDSVAMQELDGYLSTIMPSYLEIEAALASDEVISTGLEINHEPEVLFYLNQKKSFYQGKTFAEFIGFLKYAGDDYDDNNNGFNKALGAIDNNDHTNILFSAVTAALFTRPTCKYPGTTSEGCDPEGYEFPKLYVKFKLDITDIPEKLGSGDYDFNGPAHAGSNHELVRYYTNVYQHIPMADGSITLVTLSKKKLLLKFEAEE